MLVWLVTAGEPLPTDPGNQRPMRTSMLADYLLESGHTVVRWASSFDHGTKTQRAQRDVNLSVRPGYKIWLLHAPEYAKNVSLARIRNHRRLASKFRQIAVGEVTPDIIVCSLPTLELAEEVVSYANRRGVPVVIDVRDMWPDVIQFRSPALLRPAVKGLLRGMDQAADRICSGATAITGHAPGFVQWGLARAKRPIGQFDRSFPFGYESRGLSESAIASASSFWEALGIGLRGHGLVVSYVGSISHQFQFKPVLEAARRLEGKVRVTFVLCGTGDRLDSFREKSSGLSNVHMPGWVSLPQAWALLQQRSSIGLVPLNGTPDFLLSIPNKIAEYLAAGLPIAASFRTGMVRDLIERYDCGFSYSQSEDVLVERLSALAQDGSSLSRMSHNARSLYEDQFRADRIYPQFVSYLESLHADWAISPPALELTPLD